MADWPGWPGWMFERLPPRPAERLHATALCAQAVRPNKQPYLTAPSRPTFCMQDGPRGAAGQPRHPSRRYLQVGTAEGYLGIIHMPCFCFLFWIWYCSHYRRSCHIHLVSRSDLPCFPNSSASECYCMR